MIIQLRTGNQNGVNDYQCEKTDLRATFPTDCEAGSTMVVIDKTNSKIDHWEYFDGTQWNTV